MVDMRELRKRLSEADAIVDAMIDDHRALLEAVGDLLAFQVEAMDMISSGAWSNEHARQVEGLVEQYRRPTPAIVRVRAAALHAFGSRQHELPLAPCCALCGGPNQQHSDHCPSWRPQPDR